MKTKGIETVWNISPEEFNTRFFYPQIPVIIKGFKHASEAASKWSLDYLVNVCGEVQVDVYDSAIKGKGTAYTTPDLKMFFKDYATTL